MPQKQICGYGEEMSLTSPLFKADPIAESACANAAAPCIKLLSAAIIYICLILPWYRNWC